MSGQRHVYFVRQVGIVGPIKIGSSHRLAERLRELAPMAPYPLEIAFSFPGRMKIELNIQDCLWKHNIHNEWFHPHPEVLGLIEKLRAGVPLEEAIDLSARVRFRPPHRRPNAYYAARSMAGVDREAAE